MAWPLTAFKLGVGLLESTKSPGVGSPMILWPELQVRSGVAPMDVVAGNQLSVAQKARLVTFATPEEIAGTRPEVLARQLGGGEMGFNIGAALGSLGGAIPGLIPGTLGQVLGAAATAAGAGLAAPAPALAPAAQFSALSLLPGAGGFPSGTGTSVVPAMSAIPPISQISGGLVRGILARATAFLGRRVTARRVLALARAVGIQAAATALGLSVTDIAHVIVTRPRRRRRGITAAQIRTCRRVIRFNKSLTKALKKAA